jgi:hypothetical protein
VFFRVADKRIQLVTTPMDASSVEVVAHFAPGFRGRVTP